MALEVMGMMMMRRRRRDESIQMVVCASFPFSFPRHRRKRASSFVRSGSETRGRQGGRQAGRQASHDVMQMSMAEEDN
jgi:hypothetical protein